MAELTVREKILDKIEDEGGEIVQLSGISTKKVFDSVSASHSSISTALRQLEDEGVIWSEWLTPRLRGRIALSSHFPKPLRPEDIRDDVRDRIAEAVDKGLQEVMDAVADDAWVAEVDRLEQENHSLHETINDLVSRLRQASEQINDLSEEVRQQQNIVRSIKGSFEAYKSTVKKQVRESREAKKAAQEFEEALGEVQADKDFTFTHHAVQRMKEMKLGKGEVLRVLAKPDVDYTSSRYGEHCRMAQRDDLGVAYDSQNRTIITIVWNKVEQWTRDEFVEQRENGG